MTRRSFILVAVLIVMGSALLVVTGILAMVQADRAGMVSVRGRTQSRLIAWSAVQAITTELDRQRDEVLDGRMPRLDDWMTLYEADGRQGVVRLLPIGPGGETLVPEAARLDLNRADETTLVATGLIDEATAARIVRHRDEVLRRPFQSVAELLEVPGIDPEMLYGDLSEIDWGPALRGETLDLAERVSQRLTETTVRGLADIVTVYAFEPAVQRSGRLRININVPWSDELGRRIDGRFGQGSGEALRRIMESGTSFSDEGRIYGVLNQFDSQPQDWPDIIDALTAEDTGVHFGRIDINRAPVEVLRALPGVTPEQAEEIAETRGGLDGETLATVAWPAIEEILAPEQYETLGGRMTTRSWVYRVRLAAGEMSMDDDPETAPLVDPVVYEAVVDLVDPTARIAYLRELTLLPVAAALVAHADPVDDDDDPPLEDDPAPAPGADDPAPTTEDTVTGRDMPSSFATGGRELDSRADDPDPIDATATETRAPVTPASPDTPASPARRRVGRWQGGRSRRR
ncbi:MAG: helix-hairpin-helix domain-containing protein, partial [Phycisphaerae bacterium]|nr:helix-hairpin-helix domain-containing protein [Phycisphaerae bacterium]